MQVFSLASKSASHYNTGMPNEDQDTVQPTQAMEIRRLYRLGLNRKQITAKTGFQLRHINRVIRSVRVNDGGPVGRQAQRIESIYEMVSEIVVILRQLSRLRTRDVGRRMDKLEKQHMAKLDALLPPDPPPTALSPDTLAQFLKGEPGQRVNS
jgi:hypothetical protein